MNVGEILSKKSNANQRETSKKNSIVIEIINLIAISLSIFLFLSIFFDGGGVIGNFLNLFFKTLIGITSYFIPFILFGISIYYLISDNNNFYNHKIIIIIACLIVFSGIIHIFTIPTDAQIEINPFKLDPNNYKISGILGSVLGNLFLKLFGKLGALLITITGFIILIIVLSKKSFIDFIKETNNKIKSTTISEFISNIFYDDWDDDDWEEDYWEDEDWKDDKHALNSSKNFKKNLEPQKKPLNTIEIVKNESKKNKPKLSLISEELDYKKSYNKNNLEFEFNNMDTTYEEELNIKGLDEIKETKEKKETSVNIKPKFYIGDEDDQINKIIEPTTVSSEPKIISEDTLPKSPKQEIYKKSVKKNNTNYKFPPISLLKENLSPKNKVSKSQILENSRKLENTLKSFGVEAKVIEVSKGPTVTRYELSPGHGVKVSKISNLADDLALNLAAKGIRIEAPILGKAAVGIEIPNDKPQQVFLREVLESDEFKSFDSDLAFGLGKDISGKIIVADIAKMPHMLIAGATGAGKSVCINTLITSLIYKSSPKDVKLIMIDPKVVELSIYNGIPHLMTPVVTDPEKATGTLNFAVKEMLNRYKLFAESNVRDLTGYNNCVKDKSEDLILPQIVIIIDELSDLMMAAPKQIEDSICRLAQMARAAGIHLIIATQRPSVDVITGIIKANIPSRMAFSVSSGVDSRTILDTVGAEKLLGRGDMLFSPIGVNKPMRIQGAFISDKEVESIVNFLKENYGEDYDNEITEKINSSGLSSNSNLQNNKKDKLFNDVVDFIIEKQKVSASLLQRQFKIGFNKAASIVDSLEEQGFIGGENGSKPRNVIITKEQWNQIKDN